MPTTVHATVVLHHFARRCARLPAALHPTGHPTLRIALDRIHPGHALAGALLIGLASALYLLGNGRIAGIAGIVANWPSGATAARAAALGLLPQARFQDIIQQYINDNADNPSALKGLSA